METGINQALRRTPIESSRLCSTGDWSCGRHKILRLMVTRELRMGRKITPLRMRHDGAGQKRHSNTSRNQPQRSLHGHGCDFAFQLRQVKVPAVSRLGRMK